MAIALIPTASLLALFYLERMASLVINVQPLDIYLDIIKNPLPFTLFRSLSLMFPISYYLVYFTFDSDFRNAFSLSYSLQKRPPAKNITFNQDGLNVDPNSRRLKHRKR